MNRLALLALMVGLSACDKPAETQSANPISTAEARSPARGAASQGEAGDPSPDTVVATWSGGQVTYAQLSEKTHTKTLKLKVDYLTGKYEEESNALQNMVVESLLEAEAKKRGLADADALLEAEVKNKVTDPTDQEVTDFYPQVARQLRNRPLEEVRDQVKMGLRKQRERDRFMAYIEELKKANNVAVTLPLPELPRFDVSIDDDPIRGNKDAKVTIVQFADFQCPYCGKGNETMTQVMKAYEGKVRMVFRDFPLGFHPRAIPAAIAANCAEKQGKYWEMFDAMMPNQRSLEEEDLVRYATSAGLNLEQWNACRQDPAMAEEVAKDESAGQELGVTGTPAFFVNGIMLSGAQPFEQFQSIIDRELSAG